MSWVTARFLVYLNGYLGTHVCEATLRPKGTLPQAHGVVSGVLAGYLHQSLVW